MADNITLEQLVEFAAKVDDRLDTLEASTPKSRSLTILASGWTNDSGDSDFPYQYSLSVEGVTTASRADAVLDDGSSLVAANCGVCAGCETAENTVIFKSRRVPAVDLTGRLDIIKTALVKES